MDWQATGTITTAVIALIGVIWQYFVVISSLRKEVTDLATNLRAEAVTSTKGVTDLLVDQGTRLAKMETKMELFWIAVGTSVSKLIKQPIHFRKDELMNKLIPENLSHLPESNIDELIELKTILKEELITLQEVKDPKSLAYALALAYIDQVLLDKGFLKGECHQWALTI